MSDTENSALVEIADSHAPSSERAGSMLGILRRTVPFAAAWLALADPLSSTSTSLTSVGLDSTVVDYLSGPSMAHDIAVTGTDQDRPPLSLSDLPYPAQTLATWADCLLPAGFHEALLVALFAPGPRHVGLLALLSTDRTAPGPEARRRLAAFVPPLARGIDPLRALVILSAVVRGATAGTTLRRDGRTEPLPGLSADALLAGGSPVLAAAGSRAAAGQVFSSFLWPLGGRSAAGDHVRVTVITALEGVSPRLFGVVLLSPPPPLHGLTPRELEVLGFIVEGCSNVEIAHALAVAPRTVAAHVEHLLVKLGTRTRTQAAVRADREGLYVPPLRSS